MLERLLRGILMFNGVLMTATLIAVAVGTISRDTSTVHAVAVAYDQLGGALLFNRDGVTISAQSALARKDGRLWGRIMCAGLDWIQTNHCDLAAAADRDRSLANYQYLQNY